MSTRTQDRPDSARSWTVAGAAFVINMMLSGISRTTGLFYVALIGTYGVSRMEANMPFTLRTIVRNLLGPLVGVIGHRYGARNVTMAGGLIAALGVALCAFAPDVRWISFFWGVIQGIGIALGNTLIQVIVGQYFEKHRATASGFAFSGGCVGSFVFPAVLEYMLSHIGLSGTFLITGALILHVVPAGILIKEPPWIINARSIEFPSSGALKTAHDADKQSNNLTSTACKQSSTRFGSSKDKSKSGHIFTIAFKRIPSNHDIQCYQNELSEEENRANCLEAKFKQNNMIQENEHKVPKSPPNSGKAGVSIYQGLIDMCCDPLFYMISISLAASVILYDLALTVIVDFVTDKGIPEDTGKYFISLLSIADFVGRLSFGWITDGNYISLAKFMIIVHVVQGLSFGAFPFCSSFGSVMTLVVVYGLAGGVNVVMYPILVAKYLPSVQSLAIGSISFVGGIMQFGILPLIGFFRDTVGSYDGLYFVIGGLSCVTGLLWILEPLLLKLKRRIDARRENQTQIPSNEVKI